MSGKTVPRAKKAWFFYSRSLIFLTAQHTGSRVGSEIGAGGGCQWDWLSWLCISPRLVSCCVVALLFEMLCVVLNVSSIANTAGPSVWYSFCIFLVWEWGFGLHPALCHDTLRTLRPNTKEKHVNIELYHVFLMFSLIFWAWGVSRLLGHSLERPCMVVKDVLFDLFSFMQVSFMFDCFCVFSHGFLCVVGSWSQQNTKTLIKTHLKM